MFRFLKYLREFMGQIVNKNTTLITEKITTGSSEVTINLNLTIRLDSEGLSVQTGFIEPIKKNIVEAMEDKEDLLIPDIESGQLIEFGRKVE